MLAQLQRLDLFNVIRIEDAFFKSFRLDKTRRLDPDLLQLNYGHYSPYHDPELLGFQDADRLYVWFFPKSEAPGLRIPVAHVLFQSLKKQYGDAIIFLKQPQGVHVVVIRHNHLQNVFASADLNETQKKLLAEEYGIDESVAFDETASRELLEKSLRHYSPLAVAQWLRSSVKVKPLLRTAADRLAYPAVFLIGCYMLFDAVSTGLLERRLEAKKTEYLAMKTLNDPVRAELSGMRMQNEKMEAFVQNEFGSPDILTMMDPLIAIADKVHGEYERMRFSGGKLELQIIAEADALDFLKAVNQTGYFEDIHKTQEMAIRDTGYNRIGIEADIKRHGEADAAN